MWNWFLFIVKKSIQFVFLKIWVSVSALIVLILTPFVSDLRCFLWHFFISCINGSIFKWVCFRLCNHLHCVIVFNFWNNNTIHYYSFIMNIDIWCDTSLHFILLQQCFGYSWYFALQYNVTSSHVPWKVLWELFEKNWHF